MTEREMILLTQVVLSFVEEIHKGKEAPGPLGIQTRLRLYDKNLDQLRGEKNR